MALKKKVRGNVKPVSRVNKNIATDNNEKKCEEAVQRYHNYLEAEKNYSNYTVQSYLKDIDEFKNFIENEKYGNLLKIKTEKVQLLDYKKIDKLYLKGYEQTKNKIKEIKNKLNLIN